MPSAPLAFRATCGSFQPVFMIFMLKRSREKAAMRSAMLSPKTRVDGVTLGLLLTYIFWGSLLLRCGDVEQNPGPTKSDKSDRSDNLRQTRLGSAGQGTTGRRASTDSRTGASADTGQTTTPSPQQPTLADIMGMLQTMQSTNSAMDSKLSQMENGMRELNDKFSALHNDVKDLREEVGALKRENLNLSKRNSDLLAKVEQLERKTDDLECRSKRNNLLFYGIPRDQNETNEQSEGKVQDVLTDKLDMTRDIEFDRVHRLSNKSDSPIIVCCSSYKDKLSILKAKRKLKGSNIFVGEDFSFRVRDIRRKLSPHLKKALSEGKRATMVFDHIVIEGKKYFLNDHDGLRESNR